MIINTKKKKKLDNVAKEKTKRFREQMAKFKEQPKNSFLNEEKKKDGIVEMYKNMSPKEKEAFDKELQKKSIRDNYAEYIKYVYPDYIFTSFHALLIGLCQWIVEKVEHDEKVRVCISLPPQHGKSRTITETLPS